MIKFERHVLDNGLRVLLHEDKSTPMVAVNITYAVGSRDEDPERTGFAHLFEHLMFSGSKHAPSYDEPIQYAGGDSNAYTNPDNTSFYSLLPAQNLDVALFLESDRMENLRISKSALKVQQRVVAEEFMEIHEQPYGDLWHELAPLAYREHPYRWPVLGKKIEHVTSSTLEDVLSFYQKFYGPDNAILSIAGNIPPGVMLERVKHYFGDIEPRSAKVPGYQQEKRNARASSKVIAGDIPFEAAYFAFPTPGRLEKEFYAVDLLSDILAEGKSSRLHQRIHKKKRLASMIDAYISATVDPGLFIIETRLAEGVAFERLEEAIWEELQLLIDHPVSAKEMTKYLNNMLSGHAVSHIHVLNKASALAYYEQLGNPNLVNEEIEAYQALQAGDLQAAAKSVFLRENCILLRYVHAER